MSAGRVTFHLLAPKKVGLDPGIYGVYHGRVVEMLVNHFPNMMTSLQATPAPAGADAKLAPEEPPMPLATCD